MLNLADIACNLAMVVGEASGDLLASRLLKGLHARLPWAKYYGIGGPLMQGYGFRSQQSLETMTVRGIFEVIPRYRELKGIHDALLRQLKKERPSVFIGVDYPGFNLSLEESLRQVGIPTVHFIGPQIWAWRGWRIKKIQRAVSHMLVIFPFEEALYREAGVPVTYVGHPLAEVLPIVPDRDAARAALGVGNKVPILAIMPGSRLAELRYHVPPFLRAARILHKRMPSLQFIVPMVGVCQRKLFENLLVAGKFQDLPLYVVDGRSHEIMTAADAVLVASGTASLEVALCKRPMVIAYKMLWASYFIGQHMAYLPWIGLPNILAREFLVPELIQHEAHPQALADALWFQLVDEKNRHRLAKRFTQMHYDLLRDTEHLGADAIISVMQR